MSFAPVVPMSGLGGWRLLTATLERQRAAHDSTPSVAREVSQFRERIGGIATAEHLLGDRQALRVSLTAFGLEADMNAKALIGAVLEGGTTDPGAIANRMADRRYREMSEAFGFGDGGVPASLLPGFADDVAERYLARRFETAVGEQDETMRLALNARRELPDLVPASGNDRVAWLKVLGTPPLRKVLETALNLPGSIGQLPLDRQVEEMRSAAGRMLGTERFDELTAPDNLERLLDRYVIMESVNTPPAGPLSPAAAMLMSMTGAS
jgi:hypothetical protein